MRITRLGRTQVAALEMWIFDPCHVEWAEEHPEDRFPGSLDGTTLTVDDMERAYTMLCDVGNEADADGDCEFRDALFTVASRVLRAVDA